MRARERKRIVLSDRKAVVVILLSAVATWLIISLIAPLAIVRQLGLAVRSLMVIPLLNLLPVCLGMLLLYFLTNSLVGAIAPVSFLAIALAVINRIKLEMRGDPLQHWDFQLVGEVLGIARGFGWAPIVAAVIGILVFITVAVLMAGRVKARRLSPVARVLGVCLCVLAILVANFTLYSSRALARWLPVDGSEYNAADVSNSRGNLYALLYNWNIYRNQEPEGYDANAVGAFAEEYSQATVPATPKERPHIIMIMLEAFSDLSGSDQLDFTRYQDPLANFNRLAAEGISGHLVVPGLGGGTADTEADVLTARPARYLKHAPYAYRLITGDTEAMPSILQAIGYDTFALHPGFEWFYNRQNVYPALGFEEVVFASAFEKDAYHDYYISEAATYDMLIEMLDTRLARDVSPIFGFCLTIQNHAPFAGRFLAQGEQNFDTALDMTEEAREELANYFAGTLDADRQLARIAEHLNALEEPAILVCYGDHLPSLPDGLLEALAPGGNMPEGSLAKDTRLYQVPYLIWENDAARAQGILEERVDTAPMPQDGIISSNFLGAYLLELLGLDSLSPFFSYTNDVRALYPVVTEQFAYTMDGKAVAMDAADPAQAMLWQYRYWVYDKAKGAR